MQIEAPAESVTAPSRLQAAQQAVLAWRPAPESVILLVLLGALVLGSALTTSDFFSAENARSIIRVASLTGIVAVGLTFVILSGNLISLSVEQTAAMCGIVFATFLHDGWAVSTALLATFGIAAVLGVIQGGVIALGANPVIVTLGAGAGIGGITGLITGGLGVTTGPTSLGWLGHSKLLGASMPVYAFILVTILATIFLNRRRAGRELMLVGSNRHTAKASGIRVWRTSIIALTMASIGCAIVAILNVTQFERAENAQFEGLTFDALAAILVGGAAISGGRGSPLRSAIGAIFIATLGNLMVLHNYSFGVRMTIQGVIVVIAVTIFHLLQRRWEK
jgi:ribose transport system permease protein